MADVIYTDNTKEVLSAFESQIKQAMEAVGNQAVSHAKNRVTAEGRIATGTLRNEISHQVVDKDCYVGTNTSYAIFNEMGTGIYVAGGRSSPWSYQDANGEWHRTSGMKPIHMIRDAAAGHEGEYKAIIQSYMTG